MAMKTGKGQRAEADVLVKKCGESEMPSISIISKHQSESHAHLDGTKITARSNKVVREKDRLDLELIHEDLHQILGDLLASSLDEKHRKDLERIHGVLLASEKYEKHRQNLKRSVNEMLDSKRYDIDGYFSLRQDLVRMLSWLLLPPDLNDMVTITNAALRIPDGVLVQEISGAQSPNQEPIRLKKMFLSKENLARMISLFHAGRDFFGWLFSESVVLHHDEHRHSIKQESSGTTITVRGDHVTLSAVLLIPDGVLVQGISGSRSTNHAAIRFKMYLSKDNHARLTHWLDVDSSTFGNVFAEAVIYPAITFLRKRASGRGLNTGKEVPLRWLKREASELYHLFKFLIESGRQPPFFSALVLHVNELGFDDSFYRSGKERTISNLNPIVLTAYCIEKYHCIAGPCLPALGVKSFLHKIENESDVDSASPFYQNYIRGAKPLYRYDLALNDEEIERRVRIEHPFYEIFGWIFNNEAAPCPQGGSFCASRYLRKGRMTRNSSQAEGEHDSES